MKTIGVVVILMLVVAGVAVGGSLAGPLPAASVAFEQCQSSLGALHAQCRPLVTAVAMAADNGGPGDYGGYGDVGANEAGADVSPEHDWMEHLREAAYYAVEAFLERLAKEWQEHFFGSGLPMTLDFPIASSLFDPAR